LARKRDPRFGSCFFSSDGFAPAIAPFLTPFARASIPQRFKADSPRSRTLRATETFPPPSRAVDPSSFHRRPTTIRGYPEKRSKIHRLDVAGFGAN
jgi:hypothetical protein